MNSQKGVAHLIIVLSIFLIIVLAFLFYKFYFVNVLGETSSIELLFPSNDTYVKSDEPHNNFGYDNKLIVSSNPDIKSLVIFDLTHLNGKKILKAKLYLEKISGKDSKSLVKLVTSSNWSEDTLNYTNLPLFGSSLGTISSNNITGVAELDITSNIHEYLGNNLVIVIESLDANNYIEYASKESTQGKPYIEVSVLN